MMTDTMQRRAPEPLSAPPIAQQIADWLLSLLPPGRPRRLARMSYAGETVYNPKAQQRVERGKYQDISGPLTRAMLIAHAQGSVTYSYMLDLNDQARAGAFDIDTGGHAALIAALGAAAELGITAFAVELPGDKHNGGHVWALYDDLYPAGDIRAHMQQVVTRAGIETHEIWPGYVQGIRGLFGLHQTKGTRGTLILQSGELLDLDTDLARGFALIEQLPMNAAPPMPAQSSDKMHYAKSSGHVQTPPPPRPAASHAPRAGRIDTRAIVAEARARFNAAHAWPELLDQYGGTEIRPGYWACNCGAAHTHAIQIAITSQGKIVSLSNQCRWARQDRALDQFGFYCDRAHGGDYRAAIEAAARQYGLWVEPRPSASPAPEPPARFSDDQRHAYNAARTHARHDATRRDLDAIYAGACTLDMPDRAHLLFAYLHTRCYERGVLQIAPINDQIASDLDMCERYVQYAFRELEAAGLGKRQGGRNIERNQAATWTFHRSPDLGCKPQQDAECTLSYTEHDLMLESLEPVSAAHAPPIERVCDPEPPALVEPVEMAPVPVELLDVHALLSAHGYTVNVLPPAVILDRFCPRPLELRGLKLRSLDGRKKWDAPAEFMSAEYLAEWMVMHLPEWKGRRRGASATAAIAAIVAALVEPDQVAQAEMEPPPAFDDSDQAACASYTPIEPPSHTPYTGRDKHALSTAARYMLSLETMRPKPDADQPDQPDQQLLDQNQARRRPKPRARSDQPAALDRYLVELARMAESELAGELKKQLRTIAKFDGQYWLDRPGGPRDKLSLVEHEIDARGSGPAPIRPRSQAHTAPIVRQAVFDGL